MELFDLPPAPGQRLDQETHDDVFGDLPSALAADLHTREIGDLVLQLLDRGWRRGQLAARVAVLPAGRDPVGDVRALLRGFLEQVPPDARWREEKAAREQQRSQAESEEPATDESRQRWIQQIRSELGGPRRSPRAVVRRVRPGCALCGSESDYFVTREVRLCAACVALLGTGTAKLSEAG
ncbi:MAG: hypothetical protein JWM02_1117 [Frankiales bacterium]|nr:hypothetical protein [Frankiales bacterium]